MHITLSWPSTHSDCTLFLPILDQPLSLLLRSLQVHQLGLNNGLIIVELVPRWRARRGVVLLFATEGVTVAVAYIRLVHGGVGGVEGVAGPGDIGGDGGPGGPTSSRGEVSSLPGTLLS